MKIMRVAIYGFGNIGRILAKACSELGIEIVSVVDVREDLIGKPLKSFGIESDVRVENELKEGGDVAFVLTSSFLDEVYPQIRECVEKGYNVISTCETLAYPYYRYPELARKIDGIAKEMGVTVLGTGINPGFLLDTLPVVISSTCLRVDRVRAVRKVDASKRRESFRRKVGIGLRPEEFERLNLTGHVGYAESALLIAEALGIGFDRVVEEQKPVLRNGRVAGIKGFASLLEGRRERVRVEFEAVEGGEEYEVIEVKGDNSVTWRSTGTNGDVGTVAVLINVADAVLRHGPGLIKMTDLLPFSRSYTRA